MHEVGRKRVPLLDRVRLSGGDGRVVGDGLTADGMTMRYGNLLEHPRYFT